jgi:hypothetical protein
VQRFKCRESHPMSDLPANVRALRRLAVTESLAGQALALERPYPPGRTLEREARMPCGGMLHELKTRNHDLEHPFCLGICRMGCAER